MRRSLAVLAVSLALACSHNSSSSTPSASPDAPESTPAPSARPARPAPSTRAEATPAPAPAPAEGHHKGALAQIESRSGSKLVGTARFVSQGSGVVLRLVVAGATAGDHGVHIHETGDCSASNGDTAGAHFNPGGGAHHGGPAGERHSGDFGNITVDASGNGTLDIAVSGLSISGKENGVIGRAIVIHADTDDLHSDPAGKSGSRIGCGVIRAD
jgi:Cu-Zn family superoxide dismutase